MTTERHILVGSPTLRLAYLALATLLTAALAVGGVAVAANQLVTDDDGAATANGLIAFDSEGDIWLADPQGSNVRALTSTPEPERGPVWSPDGTRLAYLVKTGPGGEDLVQVDATGGDRVVVARGLVTPELTHQAWSPDGTQLTYSAALVEAGTRRVFVAQADGSGTAQVGDPDLFSESSAWSPNGRSIAFRGGSAIAAPIDPTDPPKRGVYVMDADGSNVRLVSDVEGSGYAFSMPMWSPDGSRIVTYANHDGAHDMWAFQADGQGEVMISDGVGDSYWATWSPDGGRIGYDKSLNGVRAVFVDPDGSNEVTLDEPLIGNWEPIWAPDGSRVVLHLGVGTAEDDLGIVDPEGQDPMVVIRVPTPGGVSWQRIPPTRA
jgi:TolB protein